MKTMIVSEFKAKCIAVLKQSQRDREPVVITLRGHPLARVEPILNDQPPRPLGTQRGKMRIMGDIVHADFSADWEVNR